MVILGSLLLDAFKAVSSNKSLLALSVSSMLFNLDEIPKSTSGMAVNMEDDNAAFPSMSAAFSAN